MTILPIAYMPSVEYVARLLREECVIDLGEHYIKRSQRNRAQILSANGVMSLTVNVENANRPRQKIKDVRIDYSKRWNISIGCRYSRHISRRHISTTMHICWSLITSVNGSIWLTIIWNISLRCYVCWV